MKPIFLLLTLFLITSASGSLPLSVTTEYQYGELLGSLGIGEKTVTTTYDDNSVSKFIYKGSNRLSVMSVLGGNTEARITTHVSGPRQSGNYQYMFMYCDNIQFYVSGALVNDYGTCGETLIRSTTYTDSDYINFQNERTNWVVGNYQFTTGDTVTVNGIQFYPLIVPTPTPSPTVTISPTPTPTPTNTISPSPTNPPDNGGNDIPIIPVTVLVIGIGTIGYYVVGTKKK